MSRKSDESPQQREPLMKRVGNALGIGAPAPAPAAPTTLLGVYPVPQWAKDSPVVARLREIGRERSALLGAKGRQAEVIRESTERAAELDARRVELLARAELAPDDGAELREEAAGLLTQIEAARRAQQDAAHLAAEFDKREKGFEAELIELRMRYAVEIGNLLTGLFEHVAAQYNEAAKPVAQLLYQLAAIQDAMMHFRAGNSNGWDRSGLLPCVEPGTVSPLPLFDASARLSDHARADRDRIIADMAAAGFSWRFS